MVADGLIKTLLIIKQEHFIGMTRIKDKKELLASIKQEDDFKNVFQQ